MVLIKIMSSTRIYVYPKCDDVRYGELMNRMTEMGYSPFVDSLNQPSIGEVNSLCGFAFSFDTPLFVDCADYDGGRIDAMVYFLPALSEDELYIAKTYFAPTFLLDYPKRIITRQTSRLFNEGYLHF